MRREKIYFPVWVWPSIAALSILTVWMRLQVVDTTYQIHQSEQQIQNAKYSDEKLELKAAQLRSPRRLETLARTKFKLAPPAPEQIIQLQAQGSNR